LAHRRLERRLDICCPTSDVHDYRRLLQNFWGFFQPLEHKLAVLTNHILPAPYLPQRHKAPRLYQDMLSLGMTEADIATLPLCGHLPAIPSLPRAFGVLYVIDGAALGERISASDDSLRESDRQEFIAMIESVEESSFQIHAIEAAVDTLDCLEAWLDYRYRPRPTTYPQWNSPSEPKLAPSDFTMALSPGNERPAETSSKERIWEPTPNNPSFLRRVGERVAGHAVFPAS
jgi:hypothetical protein